MKIIFSPTKTMRQRLGLAYNKVLYSAVTYAIIDKLKSLNKEELKKLYKVSDSLLEEALSYLSSWGKDEKTPAIYSYEGIQYQYLDPFALNKDGLAYLEKNLFIVSALYGLLHPFDGVEQYRLDLNNKLSVEGKKSLYELWGDSLYRELYKDNDIVINLCSEEYSKVITKHLKEGNAFIDIVFYEKEGDTYQEKGVYCKMGRGLFARYMAERQIHDVESLKEFSEASYHYEESLSTPTKLVFVR